MKKFLNGELISLLVHICKIQEVKNCKYIRLDNIYLYPIARIIVKAREIGYNWCWHRVRKETSNSYYLSSIDISSYFDMKSCNHVGEWLKDTGFNMDHIILDTESSAWYPKFKEESHAKECIEHINRMFDDKFLGALKNIKRWE